MIPKINKRGHSFKGVIAYLSHDKGAAESAERVSWFETGNLYTNDLERAAKAMAFTDIHRKDIRAANGTSAAGRKAEAGNVYHSSLSWALGEEPEQEAQREVALSYIERQGLLDHEYVMIGHRDTTHWHLHIVSNLVHPVTGLIHDVGLDKRRAQKWALEYEREHGIHCQIRVDNALKREQGQALKYRDTKQDYSDKITRAYYASDNGKAFIHALKAEGLELGKARRGDRNYVIVDDKGDIQKLSRQLQIEEKGKLKTKAIQALLSDIDRETIKDADQLANEIKTRHQELEQAEKTQQAARDDFNRQSYTSDQEQKHIDAAIAAEKRRMAVERDAKTIARQGSFAKTLDARRAQDAAHDRRRDDLEDQLKQTYGRVRAEKQLTAAQARAASSDHVFGRLFGQHQSAVDDVAAYRKTLESITQRESEQRQALENEFRAERMRLDGPQRSRAVLEPQKTPQFETTRDMLDYYESKTKPVAPEKSVPRFESTKDMLEHYERVAGKDPSPKTEKKPERQWESTAEMLADFEKRAANDKAREPESEPEQKPDKGRDMGGYER